MPASTNQKIAIHTLGWLLFFSLIIGFVSFSPGISNIFNQVISPNYLLFYCTYLFVFYFNLYVLIPGFYLKEKYVYYFVCVLILFCGVYFLKPFDQLHFDRFQNGPPPSAPAPPSKPGQRIDIVSLISFVMVWAVSWSISIMQEWRLSIQRVAHAEADRANAELSFLKAQINPHFLFNTLNNIYSMAVTKSENTQIAIMKLSNIMRYVTDEVSQNFVPLDNEVECVSDFIDLQRMRLSKKIYLDFSVAGDFEGKKIAPLILMTFIENLFKYGVSSHQPATITVKIFAEQNMITFFCQNKIFNRGNNDRTGIGIANTKQRLNHLYAGRHELKITQENGNYTVVLNLLT